MLVLQLADCAKCAQCFGDSALMFWTLATLQAKGLSVVEEDIQSAVQSGIRFVDMMKKIDSVAECAVPPGGPSIIDTTLTGMIELGCLSRSCAPQWWVRAGLYFQAACAEPCSNLPLTRNMLLRLMLLRLMLSVSAMQATGVHGSEAPESAGECSGVCNGSGLQS